MRLASFRRKTGGRLGGARVAAVTAQGLVDLTEAAPELPPSLAAILAAGPGALKRIAAAIEAAQAWIDSAEVDFLAPIPRPGKVLGLGMNYLAHVKEMGREVPTAQTWFAKQSTAVGGPFDPVDLPRVSVQLDYEVELVVVIGRSCRHVTKAAALDYVAGYCVGCDYSVRDWQRAAVTMMMGKGFDTHAPFGPHLVTADEIADPQNIRLRAFVNGDLRQDGSTSDMVFSIAEQIAHVSAAMTLEPGDVLFTGTPPGVGVARNPPQFLKPGDRVRLDADGIGAIEQIIRSERGSD